MKQEHLVAGGGEHSAGADVRTAVSEDKFMHKGPRYSVGRDKDMNSCPLVSSVISRGGAFR